MYATHMQHVRQGWGPRTTRSGIIAHKPRHEQFEQCVSLERGKCDGTIYRSVKLFYSAHSFFGKLHHKVYSNRVLSEAGKLNHQLTNLSSPTGGLKPVCVPILQTDGHDPRTEAEGAAVIGRHAQEVHAVSAAAERN